MHKKLHTEEAKRKISDAMKGRELSADHRRKIGDAQRGKINSAETREKIAQAKREWWANRRAK